MLIIFGLRVYFRTVGQGTFHCQRCGGDRPYRLRSGRRWIHLFFIPLIPLGKAGEYVQCTGAVPATARTCWRCRRWPRCRPRCRPGCGPRRWPCCGPAIRPAARPAGGWSRPSGGPGWPATTTRRSTRTWAQRIPRRRPVAARLDALAAQLAVPAREWFLAEIVRIGLADGALSEAERQAAREIAGRLGMTPAQAVGVIALTEQGASAG